MEKSAQQWMESSATANCNMEHSEGGVTRPKNVGENLATYWQMNVRIILNNLLNNNPAICYRTRRTLLSRF